MKPTQPLPLLAAVFTLLSIQTSFSSALAQDRTYELEQPENCRSSNCFIGDYNVGGGGMFEIGDRPTPSVAAGFFSNAEAVFLEKYHPDRDPSEEGQRLFLKDILFFDGRISSFIGAGLAPSGESSVSALFRLKLIGSIGGGLMLYQLFPISLALEDGSLDIQNGQVSGSALLGTTVILPISLLAGLDAANLYVSMTAGMRLNSDLSQPGLAYQPKVRFLSDKWSFEARALFTVGSEEKEQKGSLMTAINHVFAKGDQLGLSAGASRLSMPGQKDRRGAEVLFFYGRNL